MSTDPWELASEASAAIAAMSGVARHEVAVVLGSGWAVAADELGEVVAEVPVSELPGFAVPTVLGHEPTVRSVRTPEGRAVLVLLGRVHAYEGHPQAAVVHGVRAAILAGCGAVLLTNAAGGLRSDLQVGQAVLISDHLNLAGASPLTGPPAPPELAKARFVDLTEAWSLRLRALAKGADPTLVEGVYAGVAGPQFETPAEIRMLRTLGADLVGMSTVPEVIAARHLGAEVLGLSLVTNLAAGLGTGGLDHAEVLRTGAGSAASLAGVLAAVAAGAVTETGPTGPPSDDEVVARARAWQVDDPDPVTRDEVAALLDAPGGPDLADLHERFDDRLQFGTAGLRGAEGAGPNRMNRALVRRATAGVAAWLRAQGLEGPVVLGRDARHGSAAFETDAAQVLAAAGWDVRVLPEPLPTPVLAFAVRHLGAVAGIMVTASHNPAADNGYKLYLGDGAQIVPPVDGEISAAIDAVGPTLEIPLRADGVTTVGPELIDAYLAMAVEHLVPGGAREVGLVHTSMHGVGGATARAALARAGFAPADEVAEQAEPDPDFPTVAFPNPEEPGALDLALALAERVDADLVLANDPDADRLALAARLGPDHAYRRLTGDEAGGLLADHLLRTRPHGPDDLLVTTVVSSRMLAALAAEAGVGFAEVLTGFKWVVRGPAAGQRLFFGYEEALGYDVGTSVRDKDGITAALVAAELAAEVRADGTTIQDRLDDLHRRHGVHVTRQRSTRLAGGDWLTKVTAAMDRLRATPPTELAGRPVESVEDLLPGGRLPPSDVLIYTVPGGRAVVRPSGTEPKVKAYAEAIVEVPAGADLEPLRAEASTLVEELLDAVDQLLAL